MAVVGGSAAGLAAALQMGRQKRSVIVMDAGTPRNAPAAHMHGYLGREAVPPPELTAIGREEVRSYGVEVLDGRVNSVTRTDGDRFRVEITGGHTVFARRVLAATGLVDELPAIDGLAARWGRDVIHCPFCHGYEFRDRPMVQVVTDPRALHSTLLFRHLTDRLTVVIHDGVAMDHPDVVSLREGGVAVEAGPVRRIVTGQGDRVTGVELAGGVRLEADAVAVLPRFRVRAEPFAPLGVRLVPHDTGLGDVVATDATGATSVPGLYAAGNVTDPALQVLPAAAAGSRVGATIAFDLAAEDHRGADRPSAVATDWDHRYEPGPIWSGHPNGTLVDEVSGMVPGRALDVGAGEGGDAMWLAEQGWHVTAADISAPALARVEAGARQGHLSIDCIRVDANDLEPFSGRTFDLVTAHYASIARTADLRAVHNLLAAVGPGGTLLFVTHDLEAMRAMGTVEHPRPFDPDAYLRTDDLVTALRVSGGWTIETHGKRPRRPGAVSAAHHVDDVVLRARRSGPV